MAEYIGNAYISGVEFEQLSCPRDACALNGCNTQGRSVV